MANFIASARLDYAAGDRLREDPAVVKQLLVISPGVRDFTMRIAAKHLQR